MSTYEITVIVNVTSSQTIQVEADNEVDACALASDRVMVNYGEFEVNGDEVTIVDIQIDDIIDE
jgi:hypothetical protein